MKKILLLAVFCSMFAACSRNGDGCCPTQSCPRPACAPKCCPKPCPKPCPAPCPEQSCPPHGPVSANDEVSE